MMICFFLLTIALVSYLLYVGKIDATNFTVLFIVIALVSLALYGFDRLKEIDFKNLTLRLSEYREIQKDIYVAKKDITGTTKDIIEISYLLADGSGRWGGIPEEHIDEINKIRDELFKKLSISSNEIVEIEKKVKEKIEKINKKINERNKSKTWKNDFGNRNQYLN